MSIENTLTDLIAAINANTEALKAAAPAPTTRAPRGSKASAAAAEPTPAATPEPAKEEAPAPAAPAPAAPAPAAPAPASKGPTALTANDVKKLVKDERTRLADVSGEAVKRHKEESAKILKKHGLIDFTSIPDNLVGALFADFKNLNVEQPKEDDSLDDDDNDGLD